MVDGVLLKVLIVLMELKRKNRTRLGGLRIVLIVPYGIETECRP